MQFQKRCVFLYLEFLTIDKVQKRSPERFPDVSNLSQKVELETIGKITEQVSNSKVKVNSFVCLSN
jgi:uncharacterized protein YajQ (UPF0234 family)